jgi:hypothetical protein
MMEIYQFNYGDEVLVLSGNYKGILGFVVNAYGVPGSGYSFGGLYEAVGLTFGTPKVGEATEALTLDQILLVSTMNLHNLQSSPYITNHFENERNRIVAQEPIKAMMNAQYFSSEQLYTAERNRIKEIFEKYKPIQSKNNSKSTTLQLLS